MSYESFLSSKLKTEFLKSAQPAFGIPGLQQIGASGGLETRESFEFLVWLYRQVRVELFDVLARRTADRKFIDERTRAISAYNRDYSIEVNEADYRSVIGLEDKDGRIVIGPRLKEYWRAHGKDVAPLPDFLRGPHVTLFGPPDSAKMCINAMNAYHRQLRDEPEIVRELLKSSPQFPKWGADDEDSKTPVREDLISAGHNLSACFEGTLRFQEGVKVYELQASNRSLPIKRFPGLALPCPFLYLEGEAIPLHLYDFALHIFKNWHRAEALVFYVPKLENEEEARYIRHMIEAAEQYIQQRNPSYQLGSVRLMIVLENPRAVFRSNEIMDELYPYFAGASLGWHDYLASAARLFKEDSNYRIPTKADPDIVIKYIKASHNLLAEVVGPRGGIKIGGMYGILPSDNNLRSESFQLTLKGYFRDVFTQMKRGLDGFWVAHPDFVRIGIAMVEAWRIHVAGNSKPLETLVRSLLNPKYVEEVLAFIHGPDVAGLDPTDPLYPRALIVSDLKQSLVMANNDPKEIRYNVFQSLQYLTDWLSGNGCVALPGQINGVPVRIMDDLATAERSRWEVWHEIYHGRFDLYEFLRIAFEELRFIRKDLSDDKKQVQVKWTDANARWYPIALRLIIKLMTDPAPAEFATELLLPFTMDAIRNSADPWSELQRIDAQKYRLSPEIERFIDFFECCGHKEWARKMAQNPFTSVETARGEILQFSLADINEAAAFHGDIGEAKKGLDARAAGEQAGVLSEAETIREELLKLGRDYCAKFGFKFLISAKGKSASELLAILKARLQNPQSEELTNARLALAEITLKRLAETQILKVPARIKDIGRKYKIAGLSVAYSQKGMPTATFALGQNRDGSAITASSYFQIASLSKSLAAAIAYDYFAAQKIALDTPVNDLLAKTKSRFRLKSAAGSDSKWADRVRVQDLLRHEALNLHYVNGVPGDSRLPAIEDLLQGSEFPKLEAVCVLNEPGTRFKYSGAGFLVLEHLLEAHSGRRVDALAESFFKSAGITGLQFSPYTQPTHHYADAIRADGSTIPGGRLNFPTCAAGALGTAAGMQSFLETLQRAFSQMDCTKGLSHDLAVEMLEAFDHGSYDFMKARMGLGIFVVDADKNRFALHQGANDGYRALFLHCFAGPDQGKGFTILANGELNAVFAISEIARELLAYGEFHGVDLQHFSAQFKADQLQQEEVVNRGYKELIFSAFQDSLPEPIPRRSRKDPLAPFNHAVTARVLACTNQRFARAENLLCDWEPEFEVDLYGAQGKVMDSWESARHSAYGFEDLVIQLKSATPVRYLSFSTKYHLGNQVPALELYSRTSSQADWQLLLKRTELEGHAWKGIALPSSVMCREILIRTLPDGGLSRMGIFDESLPTVHAKEFAAESSARSRIFSDPIPQPKKPLAIPYESDVELIARNWKRVKDVANLASSALGARVIQVSNEHYSPASQFLSPFPAINMFDGFESARSRKAGHYEECTIQLASAAVLQHIELDFTYFVNNNPLAVAIQGKTSKGWIELVPRRRVKAYAANQIRFDLPALPPIAELRLQVIPDGGINRIRVFGSPSG